MANKKDFAKKFLDALNSNDRGDIADFFKPIAVVYNLDEHHAVALGDFIDGQIQKSGTREFVELLESRVAFKIRYAINGAMNTFNIETDGRKIVHLDYASH